MNSFAEASAMIRALPSRRDISGDVIRKALCNAFWYWLRLLDLSNHAKRGKPVMRDHEFSVE